MQSNRNPHQFAVLGFALCLFAYGAAAGAQGIKTTVLTVQELLKIDDAQAIAKAQAELDKTGLFRAAESKAIEKPKRLQTTPRMRYATVDSIYGLGADLKADISMDGVLKTGVKVGDSDGVCQVSKIDAFGVQFSPVKNGSSICPKATIWTGIRIDPKETAVAMPGPGLMPIPMPLPTPMQTALNPPAKSAK